MSARYHTLAFPAVLGLLLSLSGCVLPPNSGSPGSEERLALLGDEVRLAFAAASYDDPFHAADAAAQAELADRVVAAQLLRELAGRYRVAGHNRPPDPSEQVSGRDKAAEKSAAARDILAPPGRVALAAAAIRTTETDIYTALRTSFTAVGGFDGLVNRCLDAVAASVGKPTYNPKLFDWLCRAAVLPEAVIDMADEKHLDKERMTTFTIAVDRLLTLAERCRGSTASSCGDTDKTVTQIIAQQPVAPVPQYLDKITVERAAIPTPATWIGTQPSDPITSPTNVRYGRD